MSFIATVLKGEISIKVIHLGGWGDDSVCEVLKAEAWGPGFRSPARKKAECRRSGSVTLEPEQGVGVRGSGLVDSGISVASMPELMRSSSNGKTKTKHMTQKIR